MKTTLEAAPVGAKLWHCEYGLFWKTGSDWADGCTPSRHAAIRPSNQESWNDPNWELLMPVPELVEVDNDYCLGGEGCVSFGGKRYRFPADELVKYIPKPKPERDELRQAVVDVLVGQAEVDTGDVADRIVKVVRDHNQKASKR